MLLCKPGRLETEPLQVVSGWFHRDWPLFYYSNCARSSHSLVPASHQWRTGTIQETNVRARKADITPPRQGKKKKEIRLTFTFKALSVETPQQTATVVTERGALVVIVLEAMRHINLKAFFLELQTHRQRNPWITQKVAIWPFRLPLMRLYVTWHLTAITWEHIFCHIESNTNVF